MHPQECQRDSDSPVDRDCGNNRQLWRSDMADVQIHDGIIRVTELEVQDPKAAAVLAEFPQTRWPEITRRAIKIGLGYLKGGGKD
jgi:hypothetical protein